MNFIDRLFSSSPKSDKMNTPTQSVGALPDTSQYDTSATTLKWITEARKKLPELSASDRTDAFNIDLLLKGTITLFLKNTNIGSYHLKTENVQANSRRQ